MKKRLIKTTVDAIRPAEKDVIVWDPEIPGFLLKVTPKGRKSYYLDYYFQGRRRRIKLGEHGPLTPEDARNKALEHRKMIGNGVDGEDPLTVKAKAREIPTVAELCRDWMENYAKKHKKPKSLVMDQSYIDRVIRPGLGTMRASEVEEADIVRILRPLGDRKVTHNRCRSLLSTLFEYAEMSGWRKRDTNPVYNTKRFKEEARQLELTEAGLKTLWACLEKACEKEVEVRGEGGEAIRKERRVDPSSVAAADCLRLIILTGARLNECQRLQWSAVDLDGRCLRLKQSKTGAKVIPLSAYAAELLQRLKDQRPAGAKWVFSGRRAGSCLQDVQNFWQRVRKDAGLDTLHIHDLRHLWGTTAAELGEALAVIGKALGHKDHRSTERYINIQTAPAMQAAERVGRHLMHMVSGKNPGVKAAELVEIIQAEPDESKAEGGGK